MPANWVEGDPRPTDLATYLRRQERSQRGSYPWRLLFSDDRFTRRRRLPRLASPVSTYEVETSHPLVSRAGWHGPPRLPSRTRDGHPTFHPVDPAGCGAYDVLGALRRLVTEGDRGAGVKGPATERDRVAGGGD